jgi:hypothetical protein
MLRGTSKDNKKEMKRDWGRSGSGRMMNFQYIRWLSSVNMVNCDHSDRSKRRKFARKLRIVCKSLVGITLICNFSGSCQCGQCVSTPTFITFST